MSTSTFVTDVGIEIPAVTTEKMREIDRVAIQEVGPNLYQMMENAGRNLALTVIDTIGADWASTAIVVLAGSHGNGGGGICAARHLANRGADVTVILSNPVNLTEVAGQQLATYQGTSGKLVPLDEISRFEPGLVVDAVIGYSLGGPPLGAALQMIEWINAQDVSVVSLDVPSGIDSTTGEAPGARVMASTTLTLALPKTGLDVPAVGGLYLADVGIPHEVYRRLGVDVPPEIFGARYRVHVQPQ